MSKPKTRKIWLFAGLLLTALCLASARQAFGQATTGTISGVVTDGTATVVLRQNLIRDSVCAFQLPSFLM